MRSKSTLAMPTVRMRLRPGPAFVKDQALIKPGPAFVKDQALFKLGPALVKDQALLKSAGKMGPSFKLKATEDLSTRDRKPTNPLSNGNNNNNSH